MIMNRIRRSLSNDEGLATPMILFIILFAITGFAVLFQFFYVTTMLNSVHASCASVSESALIANAEASYQAKRDGYTGVWHLDSGEVSNPTVYIDPAVPLAEQLNLVSEGEDLVKLDGDKEVYRLHDIDLVIENPGFQEDTDSLMATLSLVVDLSLNLPLIDSYPISVPMEVSATWNRKF